MTSSGHAQYVTWPRTKYWVLRKKLTVLSLVCSIMSTLTLILRIISMRFPLARNIENKDKNCSLLTTFLNAISTFFLDFNKTLAYVSRKMYFFFRIKAFFFPRKVGIFVSTWSKTECWLIGWKHRNWHCCSKLASSLLTYALIHFWMRQT